MIGALIGDIIGSSYEWRDTKTKRFELFTKYTHPTDDSVMTLAVADTLMQNYPINYTKNNLKKIQKDLINNMIKWYKQYPNAGYGGFFYDWLNGKNNYEPYNSFGNGAAMRISPVGWIANSLKEVKTLSKCVTEITHNHPEGLKGAEAVATAIYFARQNESKEHIAAYITLGYYPELLTLDYNKLIKDYKFDDSCQGSVPVAIYCFLISTNFEDCLRTAISIGGDSDTIACIACSIAKAYYKTIPPHIKDTTLDYLDSNMKNTLEKFIQIIN